MPFRLSVANVIRAEGFLLRTIYAQGESRRYPATRQSKKHTRPTGISWNDGILFFIYSILCLNRSPIIPATEARKQVEMGCRRTERIQALQTGPETSTGTSACHAWTPLPHIF